ncbi:hypothetical protein ABTE17_22640, partial [Acinetobacter baumannii]
MAKEGGVQPGKPAEAPEEESGEPKADFETLSKMIPDEGTPEHESNPEDHEAESVPEQTEAFHVLWDRFRPKV